MNDYKKKKPSASEEQRELLQLDKEHPQRKNQKQKQNNKTKEKNPTANIILNSKRLNVFP